MPNDFKLNECKLSDIGNSYSLPQIACEPFQTIKIVAKVNCVLL